MKILTPKLPELTFDLLFFFFIYIYLRCVGKFATKEKQMYNFYISFLFFFSYFYIVLYFACQKKEEGEYEDE